MYNTVKVHKDIYIETSQFLIHINNMNVREQILSLIDYILQNVFDL